MTDVKRGDLYYADLNPVIGSEQGGIRPVLVLQNDVGNKHSPTIIVAAISRKRRSDSLPTHRKLNDTAGLNDRSVALLEQIRTIDKRRLAEYIGTVNASDMEMVDLALAVSVGLEIEKKMGGSV